MLNGLNNSSAVGGLQYMMSAKFSDFFTTPPVTVTKQLICPFCLLFGYPPPPPNADVIYGSPQLKLNLAQPNLNCNSERGQLYGLEFMDLVQGQRTSSPHKVDTVDTVYCETVLEPEKTITISNCRNNP